MDIPAERIKISIAESQRLKEYLSSLPLGKMDVHRAICKLL